MHFGQIGLWQTTHSSLAKWPGCFRQGADAGAPAAFGAFAGASVWLCTFKRAACTGVGAASGVGEMAGIAGIAGAGRTTGETGTAGLEAIAGAAAGVEAIAGVIGGVGVGVAGARTGSASAAANPANCCWMI